MVKEKRIAIIGSGVMGRRISYACATNGFEARLFDVREGAACAAVEDVKTLIAEQSRGGDFNGNPGQAMTSLLVATDSLEKAVEGAVLVVETVNENVDLKKSVYRKLASIVGDNTYIASNTSSIRGSDLTDAVHRPELFFCFNFGTMDCLKVEVMRHPQIADPTVDFALDFVEKIGLVPILVKKEIYGYVTNRIWRAVKKETLKLIAAGHATPADVDRGWMLEWHTQLGPCGFMDKVGLDTIRDVEMSYFRQSGDPDDKPPVMLDEMIAAGKLGCKSGEGFYKYPNPDYQCANWLTSSWNDN